MTGDPPPGRGQGAVVEEAELRPGPTSPAAARRLVRAFAARLALPETVSHALSLAASELVTNAVLHARTLLTLRVELRPGAVRISVRDRSPATPAPRDYHADALTGRGLGVLAALSRAWGVDRDQAGKVVWAEIGLGGKGRGKQAPAASGSPASQPARPPGEQPVRFVGVPVEAYLALQEHNDALLREVELLNVARQSGEGTAGVPARLAALADQLRERRSLRERDGYREEVAAARARGQATVDLEGSGSADGVPAARAYVELLEEADGFCRSGALLTPPPTPQVSALRRWFVEQLAAQLVGGQPPARPPAGLGRP